MELKMETLSEFGKIYVQQVRDTTLSQLDMTIQRKIKDEKSLKISQELPQFSPQQVEIIKDIISKFGDLTLHNTLFMFEQNSEFHIINKTGENLAEISDGFCGELYTDDGWIKKFSKYD